MNEQCHHCGYDLMGLPNQGRCPECGEVYDKHSLYRAAKAKEPAFVRHITSITLAIISLSVLICGGALSFQATNRWAAITVTVVIAGVAGFGAFAYFWSERQERRASD